MKTAVLIGCGAEIGSNLLIQNDPDFDGFSITSVVTNAPPTDKHYPNLKPIDGIIARLAIAVPGIQSRVSIISEDTLRIDNRNVNFVFCDLRNDDAILPDRYDLAFLATSKTDLAEASPVARKVAFVANTVLGVAEANDLPSIYGCLSDLSPVDIPTIKRVAIGSGMYCLGSCQTNGMHASLRVMIEALKCFCLNASAILSVETDIVHPDTPQGVLGTRSFEGRLQDARDNLRPSFSQIGQSQQKVMPWAPLVNTVSLRAPVHAPGYQINRFVVHDDGQLDEDAIKRAISAVHDLRPYVTTAAPIPLGSRAYAFDQRCSTILSDPNHLRIERPLFLAKQGLSEVILQSFVNNTVGYSAVVRSVARSIARGDHVATFGRL